MINRLQLRLMKSNSVTRQTLNDWRAVTCSDRRSVNTLTEQVRGGNQSRERAEDWGATRSDTKGDGWNLLLCKICLSEWCFLQTQHPHPAQHDANDTGLELATCYSLLVRCIVQSAVWKRLVWKYRILNIFQASFSVSKYTQVCVCVCVSRAYKNLFKGVIFLTDIIGGKNANFQRSAAKVDSSSRRWKKRRIKTHTGSNLSAIFI